MKRLNEILEYELAKKVFRVKSNREKIFFLLENTKITQSVLVSAAKAARPNPFHNFGHQIGAAETFVKLALIAGLSVEERTLGALGLLFHDALHTGIQLYYDEIRSFESLAQSIDDTDYITMGLRRSEENLPKFRHIILSTVFQDRGGADDQYTKMVQDSDLGHLGRGTAYWMWSSMGLIDEFIRAGQKTDPVTFIKEDQSKFINYVKFLSKEDSVFLSDAAKSSLIDPEKTLIEIKNLTVPQIMFAYNHRQADITVEEFEKKLFDKSLLIAA